MARVCLAKISPINSATGARTDIHVSSTNSRAVCGLGGLIWEPAIVQSPVLTVNLFNGDFRAIAEPGGASFNINMEVVKATYQTADMLRWMGAPVEIYAEEIGTAWPWFVRFKGKISGFSRSGSTLSLAAQVDREPFSRNVLPATYAGTGSAEGDADIKGKVKPLVIGWASNVAPQPINVVNSVYQFSAYGPIEAVTKLYERGSDFGPSLGDYGTYAALVAASIPAGSWATCLAEGLIRLGAPEYGVITGDIKGHKVGASTPRLSGAVISALATIAGLSGSSISSGTLAALDAAVPYPINLALTEQEQFGEIAGRIALAANWQAGVSLTGLYFVSAATLATAPSLTLDARGIASPQVKESTEEDVSVPYWKTTMGAARSWRVHTPEEIAFNTDLIERGGFSLAATYREGNIVTAADGSRWLYIATAATAGNALPVWPATSNTWWSNLSAPLSPAAIGAVTSVEMSAAIALAASRGKVTVGGPLPDVTASSLDDTHVGDDGTFYQRVNDGGIVLGGNAIVLGGFRPRIVWTPWPSQPLKDTSALAAAAYADANDALDKFAGLANDGILSINEKITVLVPESARLEAVWTALSTLATSLGVSTTPAATARTAWNAFLAGLSPAWNNIAVDTPVTRGDYDTARQNFDTALEALDKSIKETAAVTAVWATVSGIGKPEDNATYGALPSQVAAIAAAQSAADAAYALADGKIDTFYQPTAPAGSVGDLWFDTDDGNKQYRHNGSGWAVVQDGSIGSAITAAAGAQATADGKVTTFYTASAPAATAVGDLWYNTSTGVLSRWSGSLWQATATSGAPAGTNVGTIPATSVASTINSGGGVATDQVATSAMINDSLTGLSGGVETSVPLTGNGSFVTALTYSFTVPAGMTCKMYTIASLRQSYSSGTGWDANLLFDGVLMTTRGGTRENDAPSLAAFKDGIGAGLHTVTLQWKGNGSAITLSSTSSMIVNVSLKA